MNAHEGRITQKINDDTRMTLNDLEENESGFADVFEDPEPMAA